MMKEVSWDGWEELATNIKYHVGSMRVGQLSEVFGPGLFDQGADEMEVKHADKTICY